MKYLNFILTGIASLALMGCALGPHMRMDASSDNFDYNGVKVFVHELSEGDFGQDVPAKGFETAEVGDVSELYVDSMPSLEYRIGPMDMVQVIVWEHPELTSPMGEYQTAGQRVTTDGTLFYPYAGEIKVAGLTAQELRVEITNRLSNKILNDPQVEVRVTGYNSLKAFISGEVKKPGYLGLNEYPLTLPVAIAEADGFTENADLSMVQLRRGNKLYNIDYSSAFKNNIALEKILLKPDDQIYVADKNETQMDSRVFVLGEVQKVGVVGMRDGKLNLLEALATSGGLQTLNASSREIYVIRNTNKERMDLFHLNAKNAMGLALADRFELDAHDIVYVDASDLATWNRLVSMILPSVQAVYIGLETVHETQSIYNTGWKRSKSSSSTTSKTTEDDKKDEEEDELNHGKINQDDEKQDVTEDD